MTNVAASQLDSAFDSLKELIQRLERDLDDGEGIFVSPLGKAGGPWLLHQLVKAEGCIIVVSHSPDGQAQNLAFHPSELSLHFSSAEVVGSPKPIGFDFW